MKNYRNARVGSVINEELNKLWQREFDFGNTIVTITSVSVKEDLSEAEIKLGILPEQKEIEIYSMIEERKKEIQRKLLKKINIKPMPKLKFIIDRH
jgi:ribosome-binding factor A